MKRRGGTPSPPHLAALPPPDPERVRYEAVHATTGAYCGHMHSWVLGALLCQRKAGVKYDGVQEINIQTGDRKVYQTRTT